MDKRLKEMLTSYESCLGHKPSEEQEELMRNCIDWLDSHPNWHKTENECPPISENGENKEYGWSNWMLVAFGDLYFDKAFYDHTKHKWLNKHITIIDPQPTHWLEIKLPE